MKTKSISLFFIIESNSIGYVDGVNNRQTTVSLSCYWVFVIKPNINNEFAGMYSKF